MVALQPRDIVMVRTDRFMGKRKVKDRWEEGGFVVVNQLEDWPIYKVRCLPTGNKRNPKYRILHQNRLMLVPTEDDNSQDPMPLQVAAATVLNANMEDSSNGNSAQVESDTAQPSLLTQQGGGSTSHVWLNGKFCKKLWTQMEPEAAKGPQDLIENDVSEPESDMSDSEVEEGSPVDTRAPDTTSCETSHEGMLLTEVPRIIS